MEKGVKMRYNALIESLQNLIGFKPTYKQIGDILGVGTSAIGNRASRNADFRDEEVQAIEAHFAVSLTGNQLPVDMVSVAYYPDVFLSAGYGVEVYDETKETMTLDARLLVSERGNKINPAHCEIVSISGNSMYPEYRHGDKVIIDRNDLELSDGQIFAFRYKNKCYVKEINLLGDKIKCISLNKEYDAFYINQGEEFTVLGRILPRIRL